MKLRLSTKRNALPTMIALFASFAIGASALAIDQFGGCCCCLCGKPACGVEVKPGKEKKHCWDVERSAVCIPAVRFPWQKCGELRCGRVRIVRSMKKNEYEVEKCEYKWIAPDLCLDCRSKVEAKAAAVDGKPAVQQADSKETDDDDEFRRDPLGHPPVRFSRRVDTDR